MSGNFYYNVDPDGKLPFITERYPARTHYIQYRNNKPIGGVLYEGQDRVWDYNEQRMYAFFRGVSDYTGGELPLVKNFTLHKPA